MAFHVLEHAAGLGEFFATLRTGKLFLARMNHGVALKSGLVHKVSVAIQARKSLLSSKQIGLKIKITIK